MYKLILLLSGVPLLFAEIQAQGSSNFSNWKLSSASISEQIHAICPPTISTEVDGNQALVRYQLPKNEKGFLWDDQTQAFLSIDGSTEEFGRSCPNPVYALEEAVTCTRTKAIVNKTSVVFSKLSRTVPISFGQTVYLDPKDPAYNPDNGTIENSWSLESMDIHVIAQKSVIVRVSTRYDHNLCKLYAQPDGCIFTMLCKYQYQK